MSNEVNLYSDFDKAIVRQRLNALVTSTPHEAAEYRGVVATHQLTIGLLHAKWSLPWRATLRAAIVARAGGTLLVGKFDSNWSLYFAGYPVLLGVAINISINVLAGRGPGRIYEFSLFLCGAIIFCAILIWRHYDDKRHLTEVVRTAIGGDRVATDRKSNEPK